MPKLNKRTETVLRALIEIYIEQGQPVSSRTLARESGLDVSSATVRSIMADLEDMGLIIAPHTSAGRVPTPQGYRVFVDTMMTVRPLGKGTVRKIYGDLANGQDPQRIISRASDLLSTITSFAGVVLLPRRRDNRFRCIEFLKLSGDRVLVILVTEDGGVQNRVVNVERPVRSRELEEAANFFNHNYGGYTLHRVRQQLVRDMERDTRELSRMMKTVVLAARDVITEEDKAGDDIVVSGQDNLMTIPELCELQKLRDLFDAFKTKQDLFELLDQSLKAHGISIFIGDESGYAPLNDCSVVTSAYEVDGQCLGVLGVIGPTRMAYDEVVPVVDVTARLLGNVLSGGGTETSA